MHSPLAQQHAQAALPAPACRAPVPLNATAPARPAPRAPATPLPPAACDPRPNACLRAPRAQLSPTPVRPLAPLANAVCACYARSVRPAQPSARLPYAQWAVAHFRLCIPFFFFHFFQPLENTKNIYLFIFFHFPVHQ